MTVGWRSAPRACERRSRPAALALAGPCSAADCTQITAGPTHSRATVPDHDRVPRICRSAVVWQSLVRFRSGLDFMLIYRLRRRANSEAVCLATGRSTNAPLNLNETPIGNLWGGRLSPQASTSKAGVTETVSAPMASF